MPLNCPKTELAVSVLQVEYPAPKNVVITIEFTTNTRGVFCVSLTLLFIVTMRLECISVAYCSPIKRHQVRDVQYPLFSKLSSHCMHGLIGIHFLFKIMYF